MDKLRKYFKNSLKVLLVLLTLTFIMPEVVDVNAGAESYVFGFDVYNVTDVAACNSATSNAVADACFAAAMNGSLNSNKLSNNDGVQTGDLLMIIPKGTWGSDNTAYTFQLNWSMDDTYLEQLNMYSLNKKNLSSCDNGASYGIFPCDSSYNFTGINIGVSSQSDNAPDGYVAYLLYDNNFTDAIKGASGPIMAGFARVKNAFTGSSLTSVISYDTDEDNMGGMDENEDETFFDASSSEVTFNSFTLSTYTAPVVKSSDTTLNALTASVTFGGNTYTYNNFGFVASDTTKRNYTIVVPNEAESITFTATATDSANAEFDPGHVGTARSIPTVGNNSLTIGVTAEDSTHDVYNITVKRLSADTTLKTFTTTNSVSYGTLANINSNHGGTATVPYKTTSTTITATGATGATVIVSNSGTWNFTTDDLADQNTSSTITVNAENCATTYNTVPGNTCSSQTYNFTTTRTAPSKDVTLSAIYVDGVLVADPFNPATKTYTLTDAASTKNTIAITATLGDSKSKIHSGTGSNIAVNDGDNQYDIVVYSEDCESGPSSVCTQDTYTLYLHKLNNNKLLSNLTVTADVTGGSLVQKAAPTQGFSSSIKEYTYKYVETSTSFDVTATVAETGKSFITILDMSSSNTVDNTNKTPDTATMHFNSVPTKVGVVVTSEEGYYDLYTIEFSRILSSNNNLTALALDNATLSPAFPNGTNNGTTYSATVGPEVSSSVVTYTRADERAQVTVTGNTNYNFGSGNQITVNVKAEDNSEKNYVINVTRQKYNISSITDLRVGIDSATPTTVTGFAVDTPTYTIATQESPLPYSTGSITIAVDKTNSYASVTGDGTHTLQTGKNEFDVVITSQDESSHTDYKIIVYKAKNTDKETKSLTVKGVTANPTSTDGVYEVTLPNSVESIVANDVVVTVGTGATVEKTTGNLSLSTESVNVYHYKVIAEDESEKEYTINITRALSTNANLINITDNLGKISYDYSVQEYEIDVNNSVEAITLNFTAQDATTTIAVDSEHSGVGTLQYTKELVVGQNEVIATTTSTGANVQIYKVIINRLEQTTPPTETITSVSFGHTIDTTYIRTVAENVTIDQIKAQLDNDDAKLSIFMADTTTPADTTKPVGTGMVVKLIVGGEPIDSKVILITGDCSGDGLLDASDISAIINHYLGTVPLTGAKLIAANASKDALGEVDASDISAIINHYLGTNPIVFK